MDQDPKKFGIVVKPHGSGAFELSQKDFFINNIFELLPKSRHKAGEGLVSGKYPFFTSSQQQTKWFDVAEYAHESLIFGTGGMPSVHCAANFSTSTDVFVLVPKRENISVKYVYYFFSYRKEILEKGFKGAGLKHLSSEYTKKIQIPLPVDQDGNPDLAEQKRIVSILEKAEELKKKRAEADQTMDRLIPSLYKKFFAFDKFPEIEIKNIIKDKSAIRTGPFGSQLHHHEFISAGVPVLGIDNAVLNTFRWGKIRCLPLEKYKSFKRFRVYPGDVLVTIMGTVGRACVTPDNLPECMSTKHLCVITPDSSKINPVYLWAALLYDQNVRTQTKNVAKGAIMEGWNSTIIKQIKISVPPIDLQNEFSDIVKELKLYKEKQEQSAEKIDEVFQSLLARAFSGEL